MADYQVLVLARGNDTRKDLMGSHRGEKSFTNHRDAIIYEHYTTAHSAKEAESLIREAHTKPHQTRICKVLVNRIYWTGKSENAKKSRYALDGFRLFSNLFDDWKMENLANALFSHTQSFSNGRNFNHLPKPSRMFDSPACFVWTRMVASEYNDFLSESEGAGPVSMFVCSKNLDTLLALDPHEDWVRVKQPTICRR